MCDATIFNVEFVTAALIWVIIVLDIISVCDLLIGSDYSILGL